MRINVDLIPANSTERLWGESYESELDDLLALQARLARAISRQIRVNIAPLEEKWFDEERSVDPDAYKAYLKGRYYRSLVSYPGLEKAEFQGYKRRLVDTAPWHISAFSI
ncbi:MAG: hypothetical protein IH998_07520 [Proteobacteria bacterium]|nr:hypothetical protein [Pseudomonadota bacterium]